MFKETKLRYRRSSL